MMHYLYPNSIDTIKTINTICFLLANVIIQRYALTNLYLSSLSLSVVWDVKMTCTDSLILLAGHQDHLGPDSQNFLRFSKVFPKSCLTYS